MKNTFRLTYFVITLLLFYSCGSTKYIDISETNLTDQAATPETKLLLENIKLLAKEGIGIGHQDATAYGLNWKASAKDTFRNDIHDVVGKYPLVYGWEIGHIELANTINLDTVSFNLMRKQIATAYKLGGINTISWHLDNPETDGSSWDPTPAARGILSNGENRDKYLTWVNRLADFLKSLKTDSGTAIPVVFRPYHEMNGSWFWWGANNCTTDEYKDLFRDLVDLMEEKGVHNVLYAYAPNSLNSPEEYERFYPGDDYVDILGIDIYNHSGDATFAEKLKNDIGVMRDFAKTRNKPYALTETGNVKPENPNWFTEILYPGIENSGIAWVLFWRNARENHYFATYPTEIAAESFKKLGQKNDILFMDDIKTYKIKK